MSYSIHTILHPHVNKQGTQSVMIRVISERKKYYAKTKFKVKESQFEKGLVINHPLAKQINNAIAVQRLEIEGNIVDAITHKRDSGAKIGEIVKDKYDSQTFADFTEYLIKKSKGKFSVNTLHNYRVAAKKLNTWKPGIKLTDCTFIVLTDFEEHVRRSGNMINTISKTMQMVKSILNKAADIELINRANFEKYKRPKTEQNIPVWLVESELEKLSKVVFSIGAESQRQAGYYFLLSCYTGYRISDAKSFTKEMISDGSIILRAKKNGAIVSIPVHSKLGPIVNYCQDHPFTLSEQKARKNVKQLCRLAGIKKDVRFHSARHTFAMLLMSKGFNVDEVSEFIGDTPLITKVYARVNNDLLKKKIIDIFN